MAFWGAGMGGMVPDKFLQGIINQGILESMNA
jgi:hypothetical protein